MSAPVDVLAVLSRAEGNARTLAMMGDSTYREHLVELAKAHAAIAELISKAGNAATLLSNLIAARQVDARYGDHVTDLTAALANIGGQP